MKRTFLTFLFSITLIAAPPAPNPPVVDDATQIEVLATQLDISAAVSAAKEAAAPYNDKIKEAQLNAAPPLERAKKQCTNKFAPALRDHKVVCVALPEPAKPVAASDASSVKTGPLSEPAK